ncbi:ornithine decarboxylase antizyme [Diplodia corticola]|uniref:Ornithine decarboxylase antizyme n=1 Tax=Diplodia corticola TaxID=236234 RepID=A0A1J9QW95_9PEZI|nr:ornithine decarboxylase antizyme [Diplodia corticola]OJD32657.1 ornithine decarboxylase antizyme [Diplodia corticola]
MLLPCSSRASTTPLPGPAGPSGVPEVSSGMPSPPQSPPLAAYAVTSDELSMTQSKRRVGAARRGGAACTIAEECERLFCETLRTVFLGEGNMSRQDSLAMGMYNTNNHDYSTAMDDDDAKRMDGSYDSGIGMPSPPSGASLAVDYGFPQQQQQRGQVGQWIEVWDYVGGARFRGFVAGTGDEKAMFVFFDAEATVRDLKPGLMALIELCGLDDFECARLNVCLDRKAPTEDMKGFMKDLGWIGFEPITLAEWAEKPPIVSDAWVFLGMEV